MAGKYVKLMKDVDMNESNFMIATFAGTFDGNNHTVSGLKLESGSFEVPTGLFCDLEASGTIKNLIVRGSATTVWTTAGLVGRSADNIDNCKNYINVTSEWDVGGVVGWAKDNVNVTNCKNYGNVNAMGNDGTDAAGAGVVGCVSNNVAVTYCENHGEITGRNGIAGIVGGRGNTCNTNVTIQNCTNYASVTSSGNMAGGIVAQMHAGAGQTAVVSNCVNEGAVYALNGDSAGIVGCLYGYAAADSCTNKGVITAGAGNVNGICTFDENEPSTTNCQDLSAQ